MGIQEQQSGVREQYERWPYPHFPRLAALRRQDTWQLNLDYLWDRCGSGPAPRPGRIWIAGCGTFQSYAFGLANPGAEILATDLSERSLDIARRRCLWHGQTRSRFVQVDLEDPESMPQGPFDLIECYGVLMNLSDPAASLAAMAARLSPGGVLRLMVYPHYSRQRVFQIQRVARLLGLHWRDPEHPQLLQQLCRALPQGHPLRYGFESYPDSGNAAGIVDGFLHAGDRGFCAGELGDLIISAGLEPACWIHKPWGQPTLMARDLELAEDQPFALLDHLDLWQELRSNFVVCLRRPATLIPRPGAPRLHPLLQPSGRGLPLPARAQALQYQLTGLNLPSRVHERALRWSRRELSALRRAARGEPPRPGDLPLIARGRREGLLLDREPQALSRTEPLLPPRREPHLQRGPHASNPLYWQLFAAYQSAAPQLQQELDRWRAHAAPLEPKGGYGLTPYGTWLSRSPELHSILRAEANSPAADYAEIRYRDEVPGRRRLRSFLRGLDLPTHPLSDAAERELWVLLGTHRQLSLPTC